VVLSVVRKMAEAKVHISMEQRIIIKFLTKEGCKPSEKCSRLKRRYGEKTVSNVSVYKWSSAFRKGRETVENEPHERRPRTSITGENSDRINALIWENRQITVSELSGILNVSDGSGKTIIKQHPQYSKGTSGTREKGRKYQCHFSRTLPVNTWLIALWTPSRN
jgi:transposase